MKLTECCTDSRKYATMAHNGPRLPDASMETMIREGAEAMEQLMMPLQIVLDHLTAFLGKNPLLGIWYTAFVRFFFPVLAIMILYRAIRSLLKIPTAPEIWGQLSLPNGTPMFLTHWENVIGRGKTADVRLSYPTVSRHPCAE